MLNKIEAVLTIADFRMKSKIEAALKERQVPVNYAWLGNGSTNLEMLNMLGLVDTKKIVFLSFIPEVEVPSYYKTLDRELNFNNSGTGIAVSLYLSGVCSSLAKMYQSEIQDESNKLDEVKKVKSHQHELIMVIVSMGQFDKVMETAKAAGATGGTLIHARGLATDEAVKYLGITIQPEKDIVLIVTKRELKHQIMQAISAEMNLPGEGKGICISMPIDSATGLRE